MGNGRLEVLAALVPDRLGLGTAPLAGLFEHVSDDQAAAAIGRAWQLGLRFFDTAPSYGSGTAERRLGLALEGRPRDTFVVSTKVGRLLRPGTPDPTFVDAAPFAAEFDFSYDGALRSLEESLTRLRLDRVDIALIHDPDNAYEQAVVGAYRALARLRDEEVVAAIGVGMNQTALLARFARETDIDCVLVAGRYTLLDRSAAEQLFPICQDENVAVIAAGVFNSGILAGGDNFDYRPAAPAIRARVDELRRICGRWQEPLRSAALQFPLRHPAVGFVLVGCRSAEEVEECEQLRRRPLPDALWDEVA